MPLKFANIEHIVSDSHSVCKDLISITWFLLDMSFLRVNFGAKVTKEIIEGKIQHFMLWIFSLVFL